MKEERVPSWQRKSGKATSCRGISLRNAGRWQRGFPVTILRFLSQMLSHARWQLQLNGLANRFLPFTHTHTHTHTHQHTHTHKDINWPPMQHQTCPKQSTLSMEYYFVIHYAQHWICIIWCSIMPGIYLFPTSHHALGVNFIMLSLIV